MIVDKHSPSFIRTFQFCSICNKKLPMGTNRAIICKECNSTYAKCLIS